MKKQINIQSNQSAILDNDFKLLRHIDKVSNWLQNDFTYPISTSINLTNICNHRCPDCMVINMLHSTTHDKLTIPYDRACQIIKELAQAGVKTINLGGGGDPSMYKELSKIIRLINSLGMECSVTTNATNLSDEDIQTFAECCSWVRISLDADSPEIYKLTHAQSEKSFNKTINNIKHICDYKKAIKSEIEVSTAYLVGPHTIKGISNFVNLSKSLGVDHVRIRPFFTHGDEKPFTEEDISKIDTEYEKSMKLDADNFKVYFSYERMDAVLDTKVYKIPPCNIHHFHAQISSDQKMWVCCHHLDVDGFCVGDLSDKTFEEVWKSDQRKRVYQNIDYSQCPTPCQYHRSNELLDKLSTPIKHENFV